MQYPLARTHKSRYHLNRTSGSSASDPSFQFLVGGFARRVVVVPPLLAVEHLEAQVYEVHSFDLVDDVLGLQGRDQVL